MNIKKEYIFILMLLCLIFLFSYVPYADVSLKKLYDISRPIGTTAIFPTGDEEVCFWGHKPGWLKLYQGGKLKETFPITKGEGPGDINRIGNIIKKDNRLYIWAKQIRRLNIFSPDFQLIDTIRFPQLGFLSNLLLVMDDQFLYGWSRHSRKKKGSNFIMKIGLVDKTRTIKCLKELNGMFAVLDRGSRRHNLDKGILISSTDGKNVFWADNREYKIYKIGLKDPSYNSKLFISRGVKKIKCTKDYLDMQYHLWEKPSESEDWYELYPEYLPPLYIICADEASDYFMVVRNTSSLIKEEKSEIDIFSLKGEYLSTFKTPISENQWVVFSPEFYFKDSVILKNNLIYNVLEEIIEVYRIVQ